MERVLKTWCKDDKPHNSRGPAFIMESDDSYTEWWINGIRIKDIEQHVIRRWIDNKMKNLYDWNHKSSRATHRPLSGPYSRDDHDENNPNPDPALVTTDQQWAIHGRNVCPEEIKYIRDSFDYNDGKMSSTENNIKKCYCGRKDISQ